MKKLWRRLALICGRIALFSPPPCIAVCKDSELSWWFYECATREKSDIYRLNRLGRIWKDFWWRLSGICMTFFVKEK